MLRRVCSARIAGARDHEILKKDIIPIETGHDQQVPGDKTNGVIDGESSSEPLLEEVYHQLRALARELMIREKPGQTVQATELVHEAYLRLSPGDQRFNDSRHFYIVAAQAMRRILVDRARRKASVKHGGDRQRFEIDESDAIIWENSVDLMSLDEALTRLTKQHERAAQVTMLRYFAGLSNEQVAEALGISTATAKRDWSFARAWLHRVLDEPEI